MNPHLAYTGGHIIGQMIFPTLAGIRAPSFLPESLDSLLFETHLVIWGVLILTAFILTKIGRARARPQIARIGVSVILVTMLWMFAAYVVDTPAERLSMVHRQILTAAQNKDLDAIKTYLLPDFHYGPFNRDGFVDAVDASLKTFTIKSNTITHYDSQIDGNHAVSNLSVMTQIDGPAAGTYITNWQLEWFDDATSDWRLARIIDWKLNGQDMPADAGFPKAQ